MPERFFTNKNIPPEIIFMNLSHEIRTPLNLIHSSVQLLEKQTKYLKTDNLTKSSVNKCLSTIKKNNYRLYKMLDNLIYYLKINNNLHQYSPRNQDIIPLVKAIIQSCTECALKQEKIIIFKTSLKEKAIACDPFYIQKIIFNLISNAIKFTKRGDKIKITVYEKGKNLCISVKDTGIGIPEEKQERIFNTFYKIDRTLSRENEGSGMGLTIVKEMVKLHDGYIELNSKEGKGTEFIVKLPDKILPLSQNDNTYLNIQQDMLNMADVELSDIYF